jgi:hypothetical protein
MVEGLDERLGDPEGDHFGLTFFYSATAHLSSCIIELYTRVNDFVDLFLAGCINAIVANQRHPNQRLVAFALDAELLGALELARKSSGQDRSAYIREAIVEKLQALDAELPSTLKDAPDRTGKTYRPRVIRSYRAEEKAQANSKPPSALAADVARVSAKSGRGRAK